MGLRLSDHSNFGAARWTSLYCACLFVFLSALALPVWSNIARFDNSILLQGMSVRQMGGVNDIIQDGMGFIWVGGENGLGRFDGTNLRLYKAVSDDPGSLPNNYIWDMEVDQRGRLWIGTSGGLCIYHPESDSFERITSMYGQPLLSDIVTALAIDDQGKIYIGSADGLNIIDPATEQVAAVMTSSELGSPSGSNLLHDLDLDDHGNLWIGMALDGLARFNLESGAIAYYNHQENDPYSLSSNRVKRLLTDSSGRVWVATYGGGINVLDPQSGRFTKLQYQLPNGGRSDSTVVMDVLEDARGEFWVTVDQQGLLRFDQQLRLLAHYAYSAGDENSLMSNQVRDLFEDVNGDLWIGMFPYGVSFFDRSRENIRTFRSDAHNPQTLSHNAILSFLQSRDGTIWVGTENGLNTLDPSTGVANRINSEPGNPPALAAGAILSIAEQANGAIWLGTWSGGLHRFDRHTQSFRSYRSRPSDPHSLADPFVWATAVDHDDQVWVGSETGGLQLYRPQTDDFLRFNHDPADPQSISGNYVLDIIVDRKGQLWIATYNGLNRFDKITGQFTRYFAEPDNPQSLSSSAIKSLFEDSRGYIWVGTHDRGLNRLQPDTGTFTRIDTADGLPAAAVASIVEDAEGMIWVSTTSGLAQLHPETLQVKAYGVEHGLAGATHIRNASLLDEEGRLYFGSTEGVTSFRPGHITSSQSVHPIRITNFRILNREVPIGTPGSPLSQSILTTRSLTLQHSDNMFAFDFVALNYRNSHLNNYAYKLEGFDLDWNYLGQRNTATYTNLDPGEYRFRVLAKAPGGDWVESEHSIAIIISPPPWRTWWAYAIYVLLGSAFIYAVYAVGRLKKVSDTYRELSVTDPLTGIYNRAGIAQIVQGLFANKEIKSGVCVMLMDIDHFKRINDRFGHDAGDQVITEVARIARNTVRKGDYLGRWGGEEFILLCPSATSAAVAALAEKIRSTIAAHGFQLRGKAVSITVSIGVALVEEDESFNETLKRADAALYQAKALGRDRIIPSDAGQPPAQ